MNFADRHRKEWSNKNNKKNGLLNNQIEPDLIDTSKSALKYKQYKAGLDVDLTRLSSIESHAKRDQIKKDELIPRYKDYLKELIKNDIPGQNDIVIHNLIFALDAADFHWAIKLAEFAHKHGMKTPENFNRDVRNLLAGQMSAWCIQQIKTDKSPEPWNTKLFELSKDWDLVDKIRAEIYRAVTYGMTDSADKLMLLEKAYALDSKVGVTPQIKALKKTLNSTAP